MAYLSKDTYEGKKRAAERRMTENAKATTLTPEQHDALSWLCTIRHQMHGNQEAFFLEESSDHSIFWGYIDSGINERLTSVGLSEITLKYSVIDDYVTDGTVISDLDDEDEEDDEIRQDRMSEALAGVVCLAETFNRTIETYLRAVDEEHGTNYCPAGVQRLF